MGEKKGRPWQQTLPEVLAHRVTYLLGRAADDSVREANDRLSPLGIQTRHYGVLALLEVADAPTQKAIAETLRIDRATVVALVDDLDALALARRTRSTEDRRANSVRLTTKGRRVLGRAHELLKQCERDFLDPISVKERQHLAAILRALLTRPCAAPAVGADGR